MGPTRRKPTFAVMIPFGGIETNVILPDVSILQSYGDFVECLSCDTSTGTACECGQALALAGCD